MVYEYMNTDWFGNCIHYFAAMQQEGYEPDEIDPKFEAEFSFIMNNCCMMVIAND